MSLLKKLIKNTPILGPIAKRLSQLRRRRRFPGAHAYWEAHYAAGGNSGPGSYGHLARFKADVLNQFVCDHEVRSVIELGCGDGHQLSLAEYPSYVGLDVSVTAVAMCQERFREDRSKSFFAYVPACFADNHGLFTADLSLSLDVLFHLTEEIDFERYMRQLFKSARRYVVIYSSDKEEWIDPHVRHHKFTDWIAQHAPTWELQRVQPNQYPTDSFADFYFYANTAESR